MISKYQYSIKTMTGYNKGFQRFAYRRLADQDLTLVQYVGEKSLAAHMPLKRKSSSMSIFKYQKTSQNSRSLLKNSATESTVPQTEMDDPEFEMMDPVDEDQLVSNALKGITQLSGD